MLKLGFIGAGTVGTALSVRLSNKGYQVIAVSSRSQTSARKLAQAVSGCQAFNNNQDVADTAELIFITTPDDVIASVASEIQWHRGQSVVHCSGALSTDILESAKKLGAQVGAFHPLQTFASVKQAIENIPGSTFAAEAEEPLLSTLKDMATALDGQWIELKANDKVAYHAAAVIACNYLVTLVKLAADLWQSFNIPQSQATQALLPLIRGTIHNIATVGIPQCLTGPIARGDIETIKKHLDALQKVAPALLSTYQELGLQTIPVALAKGKINQHQAEELQAILK
ncbi:Pyrroline-5-carboxylate reductase [subsurface metagenome]